MNRIQALDGWRGLAIALVLFDHIQDSLMGHYARSWTATGYQGVTVFFVLSGILITSKLLEGPINFKNFYLRRFFRLMPAAWLFLVVLLVLTHETGIAFTSMAEVRACVFCYRNFVGRMGAAGHFWSLSVEEQFYLVWPVTLFLAGVRRCRWIALVGAIGCALFRWIFWDHYSRTFPTGPTILHADGLLVGCLVAILLADQNTRSCLVRSSRFVVIPALCTLLICMYASKEWLQLPEIAAEAALITVTILHPTSILARLFSFAPLAWLGTISYSVYIWQGLFMPLRSPVAICILLPLCALGSYYLIERPMTRLGHRLTNSSAPRVDVPQLLEAP
jgi:peptidoglycan/LPS O-acetylase OafA/YrhL